jgi:hypothetical protein
MAFGIPARLTSQSPNGVLMGIRMRQRTAGLWRATPFLLALAQAACTSHSSTGPARFAGSYAASAPGGDVTLTLEKDGTGRFARSGPNSTSLKATFRLRGDTAFIAIAWPASLRGNPVPAVLHGDTLLLPLSPSVAPLVLFRQ